MILFNELLYIIPEIVCAAKVNVVVDDKVVARPGEKVVLPCNYTVDPPCK